MSDKEAAKASPVLVQDIIKSLEGLRRTPDGAFLYGMIQRGLQRFGGGDAMETGFIRFLYNLLGKYSRDSSANPVTRVKAKLIQQHLAVHLPPEDIGAPVPAPTVTTETASPEAVAPRPTLSEPEAEAIPAVEPPAVEEPGVSSGAGNNEKAGREPVLEQNDSGAVEGEWLDAANIPMGHSEIERHAAAAVGDMEHLQSDLAQAIAGTIERNDEFAGLLRSNLKALKLAENGEDLLDLKRLLVRGLEELLSDHNMLGGELVAADSYLKAVQRDQAHMQHQLENINKHSLSDELTGLIKREALRTRVAAEASRAQRYGFSLAFALIDIDGLGSLNEQYSREFGDEVLRHYAREVLSRFRSYDVVARYGGDEFAVLLPNTLKEGAQRALQKARDLAAGLALSWKGQQIALPGFSSVLTMYSPGEDTDALLRRADEALGMARRKGHGQSVVLLPGSA